MRELFVMLGETLRSGKDAVLVTVIASSGSTPRGAGARMLVTGNGRVRGTIGGGVVERQSEKMAMDVLRTRSSRTEHYRLHQNEVQDLGMICGGEMDVHFRYIPANDPAILALTDHAAEIFRQGEQSWLIDDITPGQAGMMGVYDNRSGLFGMNVPDDVLDSLGSRAMRMEAEGRQFYCERLVQAGMVYIFGGGHVAQALVPALATVGFRCVVLEDREDFCRRELFPGVEKTCLIDNDRIADYVAITPDDFVVVMTRGHKDDQTVQAQALKTPACYIGVIGSRRKSAEVFANLRAMGFGDADLARITTPIGLDIMSETPEEIAVSITAQLILKRAEHNAVAQ